MRRVMSRFLPLLSSVLVSCAGVPVMAQDFLWTTASARAQAMGGVYLPSSRGVVDSLTANPAGLTSVSSATLDLGSSSIFTHGSFTNSANSESPLRNAPGIVPYGAFGAPLGKSKFSFGAGFVPEVTSASTWSYTDAPGTAGANYGVQREKSSIVATRFVGGAAYELSKSLSVGVSLGGLYNSNTLEAPYIFQSNPALAGLKTLLNLHTTGFSWNMGAGVVFRPTDKLQLNVAWKSQSTIDSTGRASGDLNQQFAALGIAAPSTFHYSATVHNVLPQSVTAGISRRIDGHWILAVQGNFAGWKSAFSQLPVSLTKGDNVTVNGILQSSSLNDTVPVQWKNQLSVHGGIERLITENVSLQIGFAHANNPVPASTLTPLTAAIFTNKATAGTSYRRGRWHFGLAYGISPVNSEHVGFSGLRSGEYSNSSVRVGLQSLVLDSSYQF